jgi:alkylation response protein AidB-like acyl-CoA dehydrogenase
LDDVRVPKRRLVPGYKGCERPTADGAIFQIIEAIVDTGIAQNVIQAVGDLALRVQAAQALLEAAGRAIDRAVENPTQGSVAEAQLAVAETKILSIEAARAATNELFELVGTLATSAELNLDRHWRNGSHCHAE